MEQSEDKKIGAQVVLPEHLWDALDDYAFPHGKTRGEVIAEALEAYLREKVRKVAA